MSDTSNPTSRALAARDEDDGSPKAMVVKYRGQLAEVMPTHVNADTWLRVTQGALRKGKRSDRNPGMTQLEVAAANNPMAFMQTLLEAARLGLEPGTDQFYLTPRRVRVAGQWQEEILGIVGYQGYIELMYRAGAVTSVIAECVYSNDVFVWRPGSLDVDMINAGMAPRWEGSQVTPYHDVDWMAGDRGTLVLAYAYARMRSGATSKVVVMNATDIARIKSKSSSAGSDYSPWATDEPAMWLKSVARQLRKWVPTSTEIRTDAPTTAVPVPVPVVEHTPDRGDRMELPPGDAPDEFDGAGEADTEHVPDDDVVVLDDDAPAEAEQDADATDAEVEPEPAKAMRPVPTADEDGEPTTMTEPQRRKMHGLLRTKRGAVGPGRFGVIGPIIGRDIESTNDLSAAEAQQVIDVLELEADLPAAEDR